VLAPYVRIVGWIVEQPPEPPLPQVPILLTPKLPTLMPPEATVILDANAGVAYIEPSVGVLARYQAQLLRTATHTRFHLESTHLPVRTWDNRPIQLGGIATDWEAVSQVAQAGAELVWLTIDGAARKHRGDGARAGRQAAVAALARLYAAHDNAYWQWLLRASAELNLTLFVARVDALQEAADSLAAAREALRTEQQPLGAVEVGLLAHDALPEAIEPLPCAVGWEVQEWTQPACRTPLAGADGRALAGCAARGDGARRGSRNARARAGA
jgi:hypothetical protein